MNTKKLFGLNPGFGQEYYINLLKNLIFIRYGIRSEKIELHAEPEKIVNGLKVIRKGQGDLPSKNSLLVGTVRMGFGHHRMAYSLYTWAKAKGFSPYLHDILAIESNEATAIKEVDGWYSYMSRLSSELGGGIEWLWGQITSQGNLGSLAFSCALAEKYTNLMGELDRDIPYISTYPLNGQIAVEAGVKKVVHLIPDNYPQYYLLVPQALNLVQSPAAYMKFIEMGVPKENLEYAGHWVSEPIASNAISDSRFRIKRDEKKRAKRFLLPIGGAGAQKNYTIKLFSLCKDRLKSGEFHLLINTGDHTGLCASFQEELAKLGISHKVISDWDALNSFCSNYSLDKSDEISEPVVLFNFKDYFEAFSATDLLIRVSDVLMTKPSELAFFPVPKLFIRRVGDHEAASAFRSMELGEGTIECREPEQALEMIRLILEQSDIYHRMNECVIRNSEEGIYQGSKKAVEIATSV